ncbi:hypothetical protein ANN_27342, partial [Periplaneta americana]
LEISEQTLGYKHKRKKDWITTLDWEATERRGKLKQQINASKTRNQISILANEYNAVNKEVKRLARRDKRKWIDEMANKVEEAANKRDLKTLYQTTKILSKKMSILNYSVRNKDDVLLTREEDQITRWKQYFEEILTKENNETNNLDQETEEMNYMDAGINVDPPNLNEVKTALKQIRNGKAPGKDQICPEILTCDIEITALTLLPLFREIWKNETVPLIGSVV